MPEVPFGKNATCSEKARKNRNVFGKDGRLYNAAAPVPADPPPAPADMAALEINFIFCNLAFNDAIARMDGAERLRTLDRLREAIAKCPSSLGLGSFWAHMQSCSDDEWDRTMARIDDVGRPPSALWHSPPSAHPQRSGIAVCLRSNQRGACSGICCGAFCRSAASAARRSAETPSGPTPAPARTSSGC